MGGKVTTGTPNTESVAAEAPASSASENENDNTEEATAPEVAVVSNSYFILYTIALIWTAAPSG